jgi:hypothetical protein
MYQRDIFSGVRQYIGEQLLLKSIFYKVNLKRAMATLPLILVLSQGILLYSIMVFIGCTQTSPCMRNQQPVFEYLFRRHSEIIFSWQSFLMCYYLSLVCNSHTAQFQPIGKKGETAQGDNFPSRQGMFKRVYIQWGLYKMLQYLVSVESSLL